MKRRAVNVFSLSFLDIITCGLGAIILLFVLVNAKSAAQRETVTTDLSSEAERLSQEVLDGEKDLVQARNAIEQTQAELVQTQGLSRRVIQILQEQKTEMPDWQDDSLASKAHDAS